MKIVSSKKARYIIFITFMLVVLLSIMFNIIVSSVDIKYIATALSVNKYEIQSKLLIEAMDNIGVCNPEDATKIWSNGLKIRSAAIQYSVMTSKLKTQYKADVDKNFPNWVTGTSSPWVDSYKITEFIEESDNTYTFHVTFTTKTSTGTVGDYKAILTIVKQQNFWRISNISMDKELYTYTGINS